MQMEIHSQRLAEKGRSVDQNATIATYSATNLLIAMVLEVKRRSGSASEESEESEGWKTRRLD